MSDLAPFIVAGLVTGAVYGLTAAGLVLTYTTSGIFNFAHGALAAAGAYVFYQVRDEWGLPWPVAIVVAVLVFGPLAGLALERVARGLSSASTAAKVVATVGLLVAIQGTLSAVYGAASRSMPAFLPTRVLTIGSVNVGVDQLVVLVVAVAGTGALSVFLRRSRTGQAMRGVVDDPALLDLAGTDPNRVRRLAWVIGASFASLSGVLLAPFVGLDPVLLTLLVVQAFGAAAIGRFASLPLTFVGGLVVGVGAALSSKYVADLPAFSGVPPSLPFLVLFAVLLVTRRGRFVDLGAAVRQRAVARQPSLRRTALTGAVLVAGLAAVPSVVGVRLPVFTVGIVYVLVFSSLQLLVRVSGQVSLCHVSFLAVGATSFTHFLSAGLPWAVALLGAGAVTVPVGAVVAVPAIRLSGLYLALATFGFGVLVERLLFPMGVMFGEDGLAYASRPKLGFIDGTSDEGYYLVCLVVVALGVAAVQWAIRSRLGRLLRSMSDSPLALATLGTGVNVTRVLVLCFSAFLTGIAGGLFASGIGTIGPLSFSSFLSLTLIVVLAVSGRGELGAPVIAATALFVLPSYFRAEWFAEYQPVLFGVTAVAVALVEGGAGRHAAERLEAAAQRRVRLGTTRVRIRRPALEPGA